MLELALVAATVFGSGPVIVPEEAWLREAPPAVTGSLVPDEAPAHLGIALRLADRAGLDQLLADLQDPTSPRYHQWLTPESFGERFGLSAADYDRIAAWLTASGFAVTRFDNRLFLEATGTAGSVRRLLGVQLHYVDENGRRFRVPVGSLTLPETVAPYVLRIAGLDTRIHLQHHLMVGGTPMFGADDLRAFYDLAPLVASGDAAKGLTTAVIGTQEQSGPPSADAINYYYQNISHATAQYTPDTLSNPNGDYDSQGANQEYQLDVEMQSVGAANASQIHLVLSPASEVFSTGANYAATTLSTAAVVSLSLGMCEQGVNGNETSTMQQYVQQGLAEGQTWFAASGDSGAADCGGGGGGGGASVDFPADLPEIVGLGGTMLQGGGNWNQNGDLTDYETEDVWNESQQGGGAGGGGQSTLFSKPSWQQGVGPQASDGARDVPDIALMAASSPGVATADGTSAGQVDPVGGTSVASPLAAGFFALLGGRLGCRQGDVHATLYQLGAAQQKNGPKVFHDITTGDNGGFSAGPGYDLATGWGSLDVTALISNWPGCNGAPPQGSSSSSGGAGLGGSSGSGSSGGSSTSSSGGALGGSSGSSGSSGSNSSGGSGGSGGGGTGLSGSSSSSGSTGSQGGTQGSGSGTSAQSGGSSQVTNTGSSTPVSGASQAQGQGSAVSHATPQPVDTAVATGVGCSTGVGGDGAGLFGFLLLALAFTRRRVS